MTNSRKKLGLCRLCLQEKTLVKAHIIPEWCYKHNTTPGEDSYIITTDTTRQARTRSPGSIGVYDPTILCAKCDSYFSDWENHFKRYFFEKFSTFETVLYHDNQGEELVRLALGFDVKKLKLFFLSILWRASISCQPFFKDVNCGKKHETRLREILLAADPGDPNEYSVLAKHYIDKELKPYSKRNFSPIRYKLHGRNVYQFTLLGFEFHIKVDSQPHIPLLQYAVLGQDHKWPIFSKRFIGSPMQKIAFAIIRRVKAEEKYKNSKLS